MPRGSAERTHSRKEEIIQACACLYQTMSFREITLKEIGEKTTFTRTSIYNYFHTKEEISWPCSSRSTRPGGRTWPPSPRPTPPSRRRNSPGPWPAPWRSGRVC